MLPAAGSADTPATGPGGNPNGSPPFRVVLARAVLVIGPSKLAEWEDVDRSRSVSSRGSASAPADTTLAGGVSVKSLLDHLGVAPGTLTSDGVKVLNVLTGASVQLTRDQAVNGFDGDALCGPGCPATFDPEYTANSVTFFRPLIDAADVNASDQLKPGEGHTLEVDLSVDTSSAQTLDAQMHQSPSITKPGQAVTFTADAPAGASITWYFGDGAVGTGTTVTHSYSAPGSLSPAMVARLGDRWATASGLVTVQSDGTDTSKSGTGGTTPDGAPPSIKSGAGGSGGGKDSSTGRGKANAPTSGARGAGKTGSGNSSGGNGKHDVTAPPIQATPTPAPARAATAAAASGGTRAPTASPASTPVPTPAPTPAPPSGSAGIPISGRLVNASLTGKLPPLEAAITAADALAQQPSKEPSPSETARSGAGGGWSIVGSAGSGMLIVGLLAAGAAVELRRSRREPLL